uniref:MARVEL domain-containing protein n=1 Tax=Octopus bimaculoides TaxID=37653 RepID=A0A0L8HFE7_OCTBM
MNDDKFEETSERTSLFQSNNCAREPWQATRSLYQQRLKQLHHQQQQQQQQQPNHQRLLDEDDEDEEEEDEDHGYCCADQASLTHQQHSKILFHQPKQCNASHNHFRIPHHKLQQTPSPPSHQRHYNIPLLTNSSGFYHHHHNNHQQQHHHSHDDCDDHDHHHHHHHHHHHNHLLSDHQQIFSVVSLVCLTTSGRHEGGYLSLPLCWHFRIMVFILVLTLLSSFVVWTFHAIGLSSAFPINWYFLDMIAYSIFAFLYLVGASLVASAFDFYEKMQVGVTHQTIQQLILSVIIGYICLFLYGTTAVIGYRQWRIQLKQYQHRKLLEEDNFEV